MLTILALLMVLRVLTVLTLLAMLTQLDGFGCADIQSCDLTNQIHASQMITYRDLAGPPGEVPWQRHQEVGCQHSRARRVHPRSTSCFS